MTTTKRRAGVLSNVSGWWYINPKTGLVDFNYNGLGITEDDDWYHYWYVENGQINFNFNGLYNYHTRYYGDILCCITNGQVDPNVNGVYQLTVNGQTNWYGFFQGMQTEDEVMMNRMTAAGGIPEMTDWLISPIPALLKDMIKMETNLIAGMSETVR